MEAATSIQTKAPERRKVKLVANLWDCRQHPQQEAFVYSPAKRKVVRAGRRGGKTLGVAILAVNAFLHGRRVLYAAPTNEQVAKFWSECKLMLGPSLQHPAVRTNETEHLIEVRGTENRIRAKTAWNADTLRGDYCDLLILDEWQLMDEEAWGVVGAPMLMDNDGDAVFIYTPPSLRSRSASQARDPQHAAKMWKDAKSDTSGRWATFHFASSDNPFISQTALSEISKDMTALAYRQEILAEDIDEAPGALWKRSLFRHVTQHPDLARVVVAVDPSATSTGDEAGIITPGSKEGRFYVLADDSLQGSPKEWARAAVTAFYRHKADCIVAEANNGGEMIAEVIAAVDPSVPVRLVHATRGKQTRAEPVSVLYEQGRVDHVGAFSALEDECCLWVPGDPSPNRMDALVWGISYLAGFDTLASDDALRQAISTKRRAE
jgi:hypothetical protein